MVIPAVTAYAGTLQLTSLALGVWCVLSSSEVIAVRRAFSPGRALGTDLAALSIDPIRPAILASPLCSPAALLIAPSLRLGAGLALPVMAGHDAATLALLIVIIGCTAVLSIAMRGSDGSDKIALVACVAAALITLGRMADDRWLCLAGLAWGAGQATLVYVASGAAKLARAFWRDGTAVAAAMTSYQSGHAVLAAVVRHRPAAVALSWMVILLECLFPFALLAPPDICLAILAALAAFHFATAIFMGLSTYPWAFIATYPYIVLANAAILGTARGIG